MSARNKELLLKKKRLKKKVFEMKYGRTVLFTAMFCESQRFFGLKTDLLLQLYISLIKHRDKEILDDYGIISPYGLHVLIYLTKRHELESVYEPLLANEYMRYIRFFPYQRHLSLFSEKISNNSLENSQMGIKEPADYLGLMYNAFFSINSVSLDTDISSEQRNAIDSLAALQKNDMKVFFMYLYQILEDCCLEMSSQLVFYFKKFVYANSLDKTMFIPEIEICLFLYEYLTHFQVQVDYKKAADKILSRMTAFANTRLLTRELSKAIGEHKSTNAAAYDVLIYADERGSYSSLKEFISDYLGVRPVNFDKMRHRLLKNVNKALDKIEYS